MTNVEYMQSLLEEVCDKPESSNRAVIIRSDYLLRIAEKADLYEQETNKPFEK